MGFEQVILILLYSLFKSTNVPIKKFLMDFTHPFMLNFMITSLTFIVLILFRHKKLKKIRRLNKNEKVIYAVGSFLSATGVACLNLAIYYLPIKGFTVLYSLLPLFVSVYSVILLKEKPSNLLWFGTTLAVTGSIIFKTGGEIELVLGDLLVLIGVALFALSNILIRKYVGIIGKSSVLIIGTGFGLVFNLLLSLIFGVFKIPIASPLFWIFLIFNILIVRVVGGILYTKSIKKIPAYIVATSTVALVRIGSSLIGVIFFGDQWSTQEIIGGAMLITSASIASFKISRKVSKE